MSSATEVFDAAWALYRADPLLCLLGIDPTERGDVLPLAASQFGEDSASVIARHEARVARILRALSAFGASASSAVGLSALKRCDALYQAAATASPSEARTLSARFPEFGAAVIDDAIRRALFANR